MKKTLILPILVLLVVLPLSLSVTLDTSVYTLPKFEYDSSKGTAKVTFVIKATSQPETGLFELQMSKSNFGLNSILGYITTCDSTKPWQKAQPYYLDRIGDTLTITISETDIPDGTYYPTLVHVTKCCSTGSCDSLSPFGWGYPLTSGAITFKRTTVCPTVCIPLYVLSNDCARTDCGSGCGADNINTFSTQSECQAKMPKADVIDFKLSNLRRITNYDLLPTTIDKIKYVTFPVYGQGEVVSVTIKNTGTQASAPTIEAYFVSKDNPFARIKESQLCPSLLQSFLGREGIEIVQIETCKKERGAVFKLSTLNPNELDKTFFLWIPYPRPSSEIGRDDTLAGSPNYNKDKNYLLVVNVIDDCVNGNVFDEIGGTLNYAVAGCGSLPNSTANSTLAGANERQKTIKREDIKLTTSTDLLKSVCSTDDVCQSNAKCVPISTLIEDDDITESKTKQDLQEMYSKITKTTGIVGGVIGGAGVGVALASAIPSICGISLATGVFSIPICLTATTLGGAYLGGSLSSSISKLFKDLGDENTDSLGYCVPKEETTGGFDWDKFVTSIGKGVNDAFGGKAKTQLTDTTMGYIVLVVIFIFILILFTRR